MNEEYEFTYSESLWKLKSIMDGFRDRASYDKKYIPNSAVSELLKEINNMIENPTDYES